MEVRDTSGRILKRGSFVCVLPEIKAGREKQSNGSQVITAVDGNGLCDVSDYNAVVGKMGVVLQVDSEDSTAAVVFVEPLVVEEDLWVPSDHLCPVPPHNDTEVDNVPAWSDTMFNDETFKDVKFVLQDGEERAHRSVLAAASEVFAGMLAGPMREAATGTVELPDVTRATMRVFLRQIYTEGVDPHDWQGTPFEASYTDKPDMIPLKVLIGVAQLAKKYIVKPMLLRIIEALKARLDKGKNDIKAFDDLLAAAIAADLSAVRLAAIKAAETNDAVRKGYNENKFRPEVEAELQALWPPRIAAKVKRARLS